MVAGPFETLLQELGATLHIKDLSLDDKNTCLIKFPNQLEIFIEPSNEEVLILTKLCSLSPGRYREDVLREALKANGFPYPRYGTFAFSENNMQLILFQLLPLKNLTGSKLADFLTIFMKRAAAWKEQLERNEVPVASTIESVTPSRSRGFFGGLIK